MDRDTTDNSSLLLDQPRLLLQEDRALGRGVFYAVLMALGGAGGWGCFITAFGIGVNTLQLALAGLLSIVFSVWHYSRRRRWSTALIGWVAWLLWVVFRFDSVAHGAVRTVNFMLDSYGAKLNYDMPVLSLPYSAGVTNIYVTDECTSFICILLFPFFWAMARMWVRSRNSRAPFGLTGLLLLLPMSFSILPEDWAFGLLLMFWCMLLLMAPSLGGREGSGGRGGRRWYRASGVAAARPAALALVAAVGLFMLLVYLYAPRDTYERPELAESLRTGVREGFGSSQYLRGGQGNSNKEVQLNAMGSRAYTGETMLRVKFDWNMAMDDGGAVPETDMYGNVLTDGPGDADATPPANMRKEYLKGFVGTVYTGHSWERLDYEGRGELEGIDLTVQNQISGYKRKMFAAGRDRLGWYRLSVQNLGANPRCVYIPASLKSGEEELAQYGIELVDDGYARSGSFLSGTREYELEGEARSFGFNYFSRVVAYQAYREYGITDLSDLGSASVGNVVKDRYQSGAAQGGLRMIYLDGYTPVGSDVVHLFDSINSQGNSAGKGWPADLWTMPRYEAWEGLEEEQQELIRATEEYNEFVYEHYTQVPEELRGFLEDFSEAYGLDPLGHGKQGDFRFADGAEFYAGRIAQRFQEYFTYTLDPPAVPAGQDFVEFFLGESNQGYCVHFASAAVLLLRAAGYPARYAEGYVVPAQDDGWVDVPDYNAHAWVEVYCGGTGWVPVEVTPAALDNPAAFYDARIPDDPQELIPTPVPESERPTMPPRSNPLIDEELATPTPGPAASAAPSPAQDSPKAGAAQKKGRFPLEAVWCLGAVAGVVGAVMLNRILRIKRRERELGQRDRSAAGLRAYAYLLKLYEKETLCGERGDPPERWKELAEKARFAGQPLSEEELGELTGDAARLAEKLRRELPRGQKAWCWLTGLT